MTSVDATWGSFHVKARRVGFVRREKLLLATRWVRVDHGVSARVPRVRREQK